MKNKITALIDNNQRIVSALVIAASFLILFIASTYSAIQGSRMVEYNSDPFISTFIAGDWRPGGQISIVAQHTNLMKLPILALQGHLNYGYFSYFTLNILLTFLTLAGLSWLLYVYLGRSRKILVSANLMLSGVILSSTALVINLVWSTARNIEYPIALIYIFLLFKCLTRKSFSDVAVLGSSALLALLVASDYLFLYSLVPGLIALIAYERFRGNLTHRQAMITSGSILLGSFGGLAVVKILGIIGILDVNGRHTTSLTGFANFPSDVWNAVGQALQLFGANFLGLPEKITYAGVFLAFTFVLFAAVATKQFIASNKANGRLFSTSPADFLGLCLVAWASGLLIFYVLTGLANGAAGDSTRYLGVLPFIAIAVVCIQSKRWRHSWLLPAISLVLLAAGLINSFHNYYSYMGVIRNAQAQVTIDKRIVETARTQNVQVLLGSYDFGPAVRFYSKNNPQSYAILRCNNTFFFISYNKWYTPQPSVKKSAIIIDKFFAQPSRVGTFNDTNSCSDQQLEAIYGKPASKHQVTRHDGFPVFLYIYNYDIRSKLSNQKFLDI